MKEKKIDIFLIQETKLLEPPLELPPVIPGFTVISKPRPQPRGTKNVRGGGVMIGMKKTPSHLVR